MPDDRPRPFSWYEYLPWLRLTRSLRTSLSIRVLLAAVIGYVGTKAGWRLIGLLFENAEENTRLQDYIASARPWPWQPSRLLADVPVREGGWVGDALGGPLMRGWMELTLPLRVMFDYEVGWTGFAYAILCGLWMLAVWSFFGGIITRTAAMRFAREETPTLGHTVRFTNRRYLSYFTAPLFPLLGIILAAIPIILLGLIALSDFGSIISGIFGFIMLLCALFMAILLVALAVGWPLMWATISSEGTDSFDALSRMYAYVYQRPVQLLLYLIVAAVFGVIGGVFVLLLAGAVNLMAAWSFSLGSGAARFDDLVHLVGIVGGIGEPLVEQSGMHSVGSNLLEFWFGLVCVVVASYPIAYLWCAYTGIYALLRYDVDAAEVDEVYLDEQQQTYGLPHLATDAAGVPLATDVPPAPPTDAPATDATPPDSTTPPPENGNRANDPHGDAPLNE